MTKRRNPVTIKPWTGTWDCAVSDCGKRRKCTRGRPSSKWCPKHTARVARHGSVDAVHTPPLVSNPSYRTVHSRVSKTRGHASTHLCVTCGLPAEEWAYDHTDPDERTDSARGLKYSTEVRHYQPMCHKCHTEFDDDLRPSGIRKPPIVRGTAHGKSKLTEQDVRDLRAARAVGESAASLALKYGVCVSTIRRVVQRQGWTHVD